MPRKLKGGRKLKMVCDKCGGPYERVGAKRRCKPCFNSWRAAWAREHPQPKTPLKPGFRHPVPLDRNWRLPLPPEHAAARKKQRERDRAARRRSCAPTAEA
jgi:hypothetical protein